MTFFNDYDWLGLMERRVKDIPYLPKKLNKIKPDGIPILVWAKNQEYQTPPNTSLDVVIEI
jgi:hypothetical protein